MHDGDATNIYPILANDIDSITIEKFLSIIFQMNLIKLFFPSMISFS